MLGVAGCLQRTLETKGQVVVHPKQTVWQTPWSAVLSHVVSCCDKLHRAMPRCAMQSLPLDAYCGFNLMVGDLHSRQVAYVSNRDPQGPRLLGPGHYGEGGGGGGGIQGL